MMEVCVSVIVPEGNQSRIPVSTFDLLSGMIEHRARWV
jgi:hypothetical protein